MTISGTRTVPYSSAQVMFNNMNIKGEFSKSFVLSDLLLVNEIAFENGTLHISLQKAYRQSDRVGSYPTYYKKGVTPKVTESTANT